MKVAVSSEGNGLQAPVSPFFGRCPYFCLVDTETMAVECLANGATGARGGAGIQAAQIIARQGVQGVVSGNVGPNAMQVLQAAGIAFYSIEGGSVGEAVEALRSGELQAHDEATVGSDFGKGNGGTGRGAARRA